MGALANVLALTPKRKVARWKRAGGTILSASNEPTWAHRDRVSPETRVLLERWANLTFRLSALLEEPTQ